MIETAKQWVKAREVIAMALAEIAGRQNTTGHDLQNAAMIIARLAHNSPPILLAFADELKD
jgi:hypothetical protein